MDNRSNTGRHRCRGIYAVFLIVALGGGAMGQSAGELPTFEVASIKDSQTPQGQGLRSLREDINTDPARLTMVNVSLNTAIRWAYKLGVYEISGPDWISNARFDITAKAASPVSEEQLRLMLQSLLKDRFMLATHRQTTAISGYALVVGKNGTKLRPVEGGGEGSMTGAALVFEGHKMPLSRLADIISGVLKMPVRDMTMMDGFYDFKVDLRPYLLDRQPGDPPIDLASIAMSALDAQLGLRLEARKIQVDVLTVDRAEKTPTEN
jgi:uncharacterized protein (TIGR03435 family)